MELEGRNGRELPPRALVVPWLRDADDAVRACYQALEPEPASFA